MITLDHINSSFSENFLPKDFFMNNSVDPKHVGLNTANGISSLFLMNSIIEIFFFKHSSNSCSELNPSVEKSKTE